MFDSELAFQKSNFTCVLNRDAEFLLGQFVLLLLIFSDLILSPSVEGRENQFQYRRQD